MKKLLVGLLLVSSALSFAATQRVPLEKLGTRGDGRIFYLEGQEKTLFRGSRKKISKWKTSWCRLQ